MAHCQHHLEYHASCTLCRDARRRAEEVDNSVSIFSVPPPFLVEDATSLTEVADETTSSFDANTNSGGDFGGGGAGGDY